ncbi:uncharacterized protein LOC117179535 isoform X2 [Belonocnema kinseyi]|uniref:uncharacterized protein LOC117179535 isoform X2 n=1 Tax=Belonocnema kinseyi TaxID=2817044 RepID=UPI00143DF26B|nr:uncharacterized protein LOC117179535 isoform X2 [Belonocnema kinseyi]
MKSITTSSRHSWTYVLMALVILQLVEFSYSQPPNPNRPRYILCDLSFYNALNSLCNSGYDQTKDPNLPSNCCSPGCTLFDLKRVCKNPPNPNPPRFLLCGANFYTALNSLCPNTYDLSRNVNLSSKCCFPGCVLSELETVCM